MLFFLEAASDQKFDPLNIEYGYLFWSVIAFLIVLTLLWKFGWSGLSEAIEGRERKIREDIDNAEAARKAAEEAMTAQKKKLDEVAGDAKRILDEARETGELARQGIVEEAKVQAQVLKAQAAKDIAALRDKAMADIKQHVVEVAMSVSRQVVSKSVDESEHTKLVEVALAKSKDVA